MILGLLLTLGACEGKVGFCAGDTCPVLPGCENESPITCDPDHVCNEQVCEGVGWICGVDEGGHHVWRRSSAPCDDGDPCTEEDLCVGGRCEGTPLSCIQPPQNTCMDDGWLRVHTSKGVCTQGTCVYEHKDHTCPDGCKDGECIGFPCTGIICDTPPGPCHEPDGWCEAGQCRYSPKEVGTACDAGDKCFSNGTCDDQQRCSGDVLDCSRPHTLDGTCVAGECQGYKCESGWGDCNHDFSDGCETPLNQNGNCGKCGTTCGPVANATSICSTEGVCTLECTPPYKNCDGVYSNGCEIPVGQPNTCNKNGLAPFTGQTPPCGTAYCGSSQRENAANHGSWTCVFCTHCHLFSDGGAWCLSAGSEEGNFSADRCSDCCNPDDYPEVCSK